MIRMRLRKDLNRLIRGRRAFTLGELLIVMAIIAILVGISVPIFKAQLEKSREAVDIATMRQAKSAAVELYYAGVHDQQSAAQYGLAWWGGNNNDPANAYGAYDPETGTFYYVSSFTSVPKSKAYGQGTKDDGGTEYNGYNSGFDYTDAVIQVAIYPNGAGNKIINAINGGKYKGMGLGNTPCIILEWHRTNSGSFVGRDVGKQTAQVVFLE